MCLCIHVYVYAYICMLFTYDTGCTMVLILSHVSFNPVIQLIIDNFHDKLSSKYIYIFMCLIFCIYIGSKMVTNYISGAHTVSLCYDVTNYEYMYIYTYIYTHIFVNIYKYRYVNIYIYAYR
jgi:hypothetical protein